MFALKILVKKLLGKKRKKKNIAARILKRFIIVPIMAVVFFVFAFFLYDDLTILLLLTTTEREQEQTHQANLSGFTDDWTFGGALGGSGSIIGQTGVYNMYVNKMNSGYYKEMLEIIRDHVNWTYMNDDDPDAGVPKIIRNGKPYYPSVATLIGILVSEGGGENEGGPRISPATTLSSKYYDTADGKHSLATYNSEVVREDGGVSLASGYHGNMDLYYNDATGVRTNLQFGADYAAIYPSGRLVDEAVYYPSKMNGYGIASGTVRTKADTDAAYFPDQLSITLQRCTGFLRNESIYVDVDTLNDTAIETALYLPYNYGERGFAYAWGVGIGHDIKGKTFTIDGWSSKNTITFQQNVSNSINFVDSVIEDSLKKLSDGWDTYVKDVWVESNYNLWYINHSDYEGFGIISLLMNGCFVTPEKQSKLNDRMENGGFLRGATVAYRVWSGNATATYDDVRNWVKNNATVKSVDESIYGPAISEGGSSIFIHYFDEENKIYKDDGTGPYPALRSYGNGVRGEFMTRLCGVIVYWKMLQASGVECTFQDAYLDNKGQAIIKIPDKVSTSSSKGPSVDSNGNNIVSEEAEAVAYQMARCMVAYSYPVKSMGVLNNGTELYVSVHKAIFPGDIYFQSCDRGVATAVRWAGADSSFPPGSTYTQMSYFLGKSGESGPNKWKEIDWGGNVALLRPGDIIIWNTNLLGYGLPNGREPGHIVMYVGNELVREFYGDDMDSNLNICHASLENRTEATGRSPTVDAIYDDLLYFKAFRLTTPQPSELYTNVAPYP